ncbi:hypothetical protein [Alteromonas naphthalenivorans]|uniref:Uncharacterized protein n=1 Tax=Alteromonas naphthalenivorans TaxID=715451 RepID=F5Z417_ALTNA|nr:hypothetical protein [Alteromonas naphthalenivorans]AEF02599.1 hypothetical protein ambt_05255 [Alteromonas naphthalenivorans]
MDKQTMGAWIVHHGRKINDNTNVAAEYGAIDIAAKSASLLSRMAASDQDELSNELVITLGKVGGLNPRTELKACLEELKKQKVIDVANSGAVSVLGITTNSALSHATDMFNRNAPDSHENAVLDLSEKVSQAPINRKLASEYISDIHRLPNSEVSELITQASTIGFIDSDSDDDDPLLFNGNLFRRDTVSKSQKILSSLNSTEQSSLINFNEKLKLQGAVHIKVAEKILGQTLLSKLRAAAFFDENVVSNEAGDHSFITSPSSFHKFSNPMLDDAFDHAKALVSALCYGVSVSSSSRGRIWGVELILGKLIRGGTVGPVPAIGKDYRALELERVVRIIAGNYGFSMQLLKREVGEIALQVLQNGSANNTVLENVPSAQVTAYIGPEAARTRFKKKKSIQPSSSQMRTLLSSVRSGGGL